MSGAKIKTVPTNADVMEFIARLDDNQQQRDSETLVSLMRQVSGEPPVLWGTAIIGFGTYHYIYASGREGDMPRIAFSPRKGKLVLYLTNDAKKYESICERLGKHKTSKACVYINKLTDVDEGVLKELVGTAYQDMSEGR